MQSKLKLDKRSSNPYVRRLVWSRPQPVKFMQLNKRSFSSKCKFINMQQERRPTQRNLLLQSPLAKRLLNQKTQIRKQKKLSPRLRELSEQKKRVNTCHIKAIQIMIRNWHQRKIPIRIQTEHTSATSQVKPVTKREFLRKSRKPTYFFRVSKTKLKKQTQSFQENNSNLSGWQF